MKGGILHRIVIAGVYLCGAKERDNGARGARSVRFVTCPTCVAITKRKRAEARARLEAGR